MQQLHCQLGAGLQWSGNKLAAGRDPGVVDANGC